MNANMDIDNLYMLSMQRLESYAWRHGYENDPSDYDIWREAVAQYPGGVEMFPEDFDALQARGPDYTQMLAGRIEEQYK